MAGANPNFDAVVVGAGFSGMYMLKSLRDRLGLKVRVYEAGETVGGTWYWEPLSRKPGAIPKAYVYCFTWDKELLQEWEWSERYPEQPEIPRYLEHVAARHDLKRDIRFNTRVTGAEFDQTTGLWEVHTDQGEEVTASFLITAVGTPFRHEPAAIQGPRELPRQMVSHQPVPARRHRLYGQARAIVGTGATAVQAIPEIAQQAKRLTVFQRTAELLCAGAQRQSGPRTGQGAKSRL